jgi:hypothetical protein
MRRCADKERTEAGQGREQDRSAKGNTKVQMRHRKREAENRHKPTQETAEQESE